MFEYRVAWYDPAFRLGVVDQDRCVNRFGESVRGSFIRVTEPFSYLHEALVLVYRKDAIDRERQLVPEARLHFHQQASRRRCSDCTIG